MEQLILPECKLPYKYIIDASSIFSQKVERPYNRRVFRGLWEKIDDCIKQKTIVTCSEVAEEVLDKDLKEWLKVQQCVELPIDDDIQNNVRTIVTEHTKMLKFADGKGSSSGDAFLIATAMKYKLIVITEENPNDAKKIPQICKSYGVEVVNIAKLCDKEAWEFM